MIVLGAYWYAPYLIITKSLEVSPARQGFCVFIYAIGVVLMIAADCQKYFALQYNYELAREKKFLIQDGVFYSNRNPNYLGEMMLYGAFAFMCPGHVEPWAILLTLWIVVFGANMVRKDESLRRKPGWSEYSQRSWMIFPKPSFLVTAA
jgi:steroid 5-alpha reductase family enzyme